MTLKSQIENDVKAALLGGDRFRADILRGLKAVILNEEVAQGKRDEGFDDATIEQLIAKEVKKRLDSVQQYTAAGRPELAEAEQSEAKVLETYSSGKIVYQNLSVIIVPTKLKVKKIKVNSDDYY